MSHTSPERTWPKSSPKEQGSASLQCCFKDSGWHTLEFYIAESDGSAILHPISSKRLDVVTLWCDDIGTDVATASTVQLTDDFEDIAGLKSMFPRSFDTLGDFKQPYKLVPNTTVPPVVHGKYVIQRKPAIKQELSKMEVIGMIAKIMEPTFTEKRGGGLCVCLDPKDLNHALKWPIHKMSTLEEITHHFSGATVLSKMDAKNGYWSIRLDDESSKLTTFNTPFDRYRYLCLPFGLVMSQDVFQQHLEAITEKCPVCIGIADDAAV